MKTVFTFILLSVLQLGFSQNKATTLTFKEFGWTISIPSDYKKMQTELQDMLLAFERDPSHNIQAYWEDFDESKDGSYAEALRSAKKDVTDAVNEQLPGSGVTTESEETISGKKFVVFTSKVTLDPTFSIYTVTFARVFGKKAVSINLTYAEEAEGRKLQEVVRKSIFK
jgi:hypothetical protein